MADETSDISRLEQLSLVVRTVDADGASSELFLGFYHATDTTGRGLASQILQVLRNLEIDVSKCRAQAYDGAAAMQGKFNGCQAAVLEEVPLATYVHCFSHRLNLAISKSCSLPPFRNLFGTLAAVSEFFNASPKRTLALKSLIEEDAEEGGASSEHRRRHLKSYCETRWVERHNAVTVPWVTAV